jgi:hypothetical protein
VDVEREGGEADVVTFRGSEVFVTLEPASFSSGEAESPWAARDGTRMHSAAVSGVASLKVTGVIVRGFVAAGVRARSTCSTRCTRSACPSCLTCACTRSLSRLSAHLPSLFSYSLISVPLALSLCTRPATLSLSLSSLPHRLLLVHANELVLLQRVLAHLHLLLHLRPHLRLRVHVQLRLHLRLWLSFSSRLSAGLRLSLVSYLPSILISRLHFRLEPFNLNLLMPVVSQSPFALNLLSLGSPLNLGFVVLRLHFSFISNFILNLNLLMVLHLPVWLCVLACPCPCACTCSSPCVLAAACSHRESLPPILCPAARRRHARRHS